MAEFQKVVKERKRMCEQYALCKYCPLGELQEHDNGNAMCRSLAFEYPEKAEQIILKWAGEYPIATNRKKFEEVFGFDILERFSFSEHDKEWFNKEYKEDGNSE